MGKVATYLVLFAILAFVVPVSAEEWKLVKLTDNSVEDRLSHGSITANGNRIVFVTDTDRNPVTYWDREVFLYDLQTGKTTRITSNVYEDFMPVISGDGSKIAFMESRDGRVYVYVVEESDGWQQKSPVHSFRMYDGFQSILLDGGGEVLLVLDFVSGEMTRIDTASGTVIETADVPFDFSVHYYNYLGKSSGGSMFAAVTKQCYDCQQEVRIISTASGQSVKIYTAEWHESVDYQPRVSDNGKVVFRINSEETGGREGIFLYQNGNLVQVVNEQDAYPVISGDGSKIYYVKYSYGHDGWEFFAINPDGSGKEKIYSTGLKKISLPLVSEDGSVLVFYGVNYSDYPLDYEIYALMKNRPITGLGMVNVEFTPAYPSLTTITVGSAKVTEGDEFQIPVKISKASNLGSLNLEITYSADTMEVVELIQGSLTENSLFDYNVENGKIRVGISDAAGISGEGSLFYIKFRILGDKNVAESDETRGKLPEIIEFKENVHPVSVREAEVYDVEGNKVTPLLVDGTIEVVSEEEANKGDVNGDGFVTSLDALLALQMSVGKIQPKMVADMDGDGKVLAKDATEIMKLAVMNMIEQTRSAIELGIEIGTGK